MATDDKKKPGEGLGNPAEQAPAAFDAEAFKAQLMAEVKVQVRSELTEEIKAQLMAEMASVKTEATGPELPAVKADPAMEEYVEIELFKDGKDYKDDVFVAVNGENCRIQRGKKVKIKRKFALVIEQSMKQDIKAAEYSESKQQEYKEAADVLN